MSQIPVSTPNHIGFILDGNRRWAKNNGLLPMDGHTKGYETLKKIVDETFNRGVDFVSAYIFSTENWNRSKVEVNFLLNLASKMVTRDLQEMNSKGIKIVWLGSEERVSKKLVQSFRNAEEVTKNNTRGTLALCFNYGGQAEIVDSVNSLLQKNELPTVDSITNNLYGSGVPPIDFLIRTSGEHRISNFMLWRAAYAELYFTDVMWPDFSAKDLDIALGEYANRQRRFGK